MHDVFKGDENWQGVAVPEGETYAWEDGSTYVQNPPYFVGMSASAGTIADIKGARIMGLFGDKITTDHISPAGAIKAQSPAGSYLMDNGVGVMDFNQYGTRRGNHEVMMRGTFANIRIRNHMLGENGKEGGFTIHYPTKEEMPIYDAAMKYREENKGAQVQIQFKGDRLWMTQAQLASLFERDISVISRHINNIINDGELDEKSNLQKMQIAFSDKPITLYSLDMVISVGYRVSSRQATVFRKWATQKLVQFATKGFVVDSERLKDPDNHDHFKELREIIRDIRASEANVYKEVRAICALCSDYEAYGEKEKVKFFASVQNKLHYAVTNMTGAEIRINRADHSKPNMGLSSWKGLEPNQKDCDTAKNFLGEAEIRDLNRFTNMLLDYFEQETDLQRLVKMNDAVSALDKFIRNNERPLLKSAGKVSKKQADRHVRQEYKLFDVARKQIEVDNVD
ncbi:Aconitate hydratase A [Nymphon striatum]|nr:Aconitate hydratase A [Nymphon striatum]